MSKEEFVEQLKQSIFDTLLNVNTTNVPKAGMLSAWSDYVRATLEPYTKTCNVSSKFASKDDLMWSGRKWYIPYVTDTSVFYIDDEEIHSTYRTEWKSLREAKVWLKRNKYAVFSSISFTPTTPVRSVVIKGVIEK